MKTNPEDPHAMRVKLAEHDVNEAARALRVADMAGDAPDPVAIGNAKSALTEAVTRLNTVRGR